MEEDNEELQQARKKAFEKLESKKNQTSDDIEPPNLDERELQQELLRKMAEGDNQ
ncbi:MAG: hypothetical protein WC749_03040 [Dehalococcoidia bacterium]